MAVDAPARPHHAPAGLWPMRCAVSHYGTTTIRTGYQVATLAFTAAGVHDHEGVSRAVPKNLVPHHAHASRVAKRVDRAVITTSGAWAAAA